MGQRLEEVLAKRLREVANAKGLALSHVADRAAVARSYFWRLLEGESSATLDVVQRLAEAIGVPPLELLTTSAPPTDETVSRRRGLPVATAQKRTSSRSVSVPKRKQK